MNILPKKRWHVRTKENIARVRRDEAEAAAKEKEEKCRIENADREARLNVLKNKSKQKLSELGIVRTEQPHTSKTHEHINLFTDLEHSIKSSNKEHDKDQKDKEEEYEKKIGYLTYLGQDTNEALKKKNWYEVLPDASRFSRSSEIKDTYDKLVLRDDDGKPKTKEIEVRNGEVAWKLKQRLDPMQLFKKYHSVKTDGENTKISKKVTDNRLSENYKSKTRHKQKKHKTKKVDKLAKLQKLREARLKREQQEKNKAERFLSGLYAPNATKEPEERVGKVKPKYNSQFNPELARQNFT